MSVPHNIDDYLNTSLKAAPVEIVKQAIADNAEHQEEKIEKEEKLNYLEQFRKDKEESLAKNAEETVESGENVSENDDKEEIKAEKPVKSLEKSGEKSESVDEYGNAIAAVKPRLYTQEEVEQKIRDRLSRGKHAEEAPAQPTRQQVQQAQQQGFEADPNSEETWETQLAQFVDNRLAAREQAEKINQQESQKKQWQAEEDRRQADFQDKFTVGMSKYQDFTTVVADKPITNTMMMAVRGMADPAAFIYAAAKQQPTELERISKIADPYQQAAQLGKLEESMRKARVISKTPKPLSHTKGDISSNKSDVKPTIDQLIHADSKRKMRR